MMQSIGFATAKVVKKQLEQREREAAKKLGAISGIGSGRMGLTPDAVKLSPEYREAKAAWAAAFAALRDFNGTFTKTYANELKAEREERFR